MKWNDDIKKVMKLLGRAAFVVLCTVLIFECCYRYQVIDFYQSELNGLNSKAAIENKHPKYLIIGDSYSASPDSWVKILKDSVGEDQVLNAAVPGTGIRQQALILEKRCRTYQPENIIIQFYEGNDLTDIRHPLSWKGVPMARKLYWMLSDRLLSLSYLNFKMAPMRKQPSAKQLKQEQFSATFYNQREQLLQQIDPQIFLHMHQLQTPYELLAEEWCAAFESIYKAHPHTKFTLLYLPHPMFVNSTVAEHYKAMGFKVPFTVDPSMSSLSRKLAKASEVHAAYLDASVFLAANDTTGQSISFPNDPHYTAQTQERIGRWVFNLLK
jgi:hypothetical protein